MIIQITKEQYLEVEKLSLGVFKPLETFMNEADYLSCLETMRLSNGQVFPIPIVFDINNNQKREFEKASVVELHYESEHVASMIPESIFEPDKDKSCKQIFGTNDIKHPGVNYFQSLKETFATGKITLHKRPTFNFSKYELTPVETNQLIKSMGWGTIAGFQTRNVPHRAHEYLQKIALEHVDGLFIQPLVGLKKRGDFTAEAITSSYRLLIDHFYPKNRVIFSVLSTVMRYAGPREAIFHAIIRRNYGCTHFIIGRDHAGVGNYYDKYAAHKLAAELENEIGIKIMRLNGPYYCEICEGIVTDKICPHAIDKPSACHSISGTNIRTAISDNKKISNKLIRESILDVLKSITDPFVK